MPLTNSNSPETARNDNNFPWYVVPPSSFNQRATTFSSRLIAESSQTALISRCTMMYACVCVCIKIDFLENRTSSRKFLPFPRQFFDRLSTSKLENRCKRIFLEVYKFRMKMERVIKNWTFGGGWSMKGRSVNNQS